MSLLKFKNRIHLNIIFIKIYFYKGFYIFWGFKGSLGLVIIKILSPLSIESLGIYYNGDDDGYLIGDAKTGQVSGVLDIKLFFIFLDYDNSGEIKDFTAFKCFRPEEAKYLCSFKILGYNNISEFSEKMNTIRSIFLDYDQNVLYDNIMDFISQRKIENTPDETSIN